MKKKILGLLACIALLLCAITACGGSAGSVGAVDPATLSEAQKVAGAFDGNTYAIPGLNFQITVPEGFDVFSGKELNTQLGMGAATIYRFAARNAAELRAVSLFVIENEGDAKAYVAAAAAALKEDRKLIGELGEMEISGFTFYTMHTQVSGEDESGVMQTLNELSLVCTIDGNLVGVSNMFLPDQADAIYKSLDGMISQITPTDAAAAPAAGEAPSAPTAK